jgi:hypothetical protein
MTEPTEWQYEGTTPRERYERLKRANEEGSRRVQALLHELAVLNGDVPEEAPNGETPAPARSRSPSGRGRLRRALARVRRAPR